MAISLTGTGGCFSRIGKFLKEINRVCSGIGVNLDDGVEGITDQFADDDQLAIDGLQTDKVTYRGTPATYLTALGEYAADAVIAQVNRDVTLSSAAIVPALTELIEQMETSGDSIQRPTTTATVTAWGSNLGDTVFKASLTDAYGQPLDQVFAEDIKVRVTADSANGGTAWQETLTITGEGAASVTSPDYPLGSGASTTMTVANASNTSNLLTNADFETWSGTGNNTPGTWTIATGTAGTHIFRESSNVLRDNYAAKFTSDGSALVTLKQAVTLSPNTVYGMVTYLKASATDGSGVFRVRLVNGSGTVISNDASTNLSTTLDMASSISTSAFTTMSTFFQTPRQLPDSVFLEVGYSVTPSSGKHIYVDSVTLAAATQAYDGGPYFYAASRAAKSAQGDYWTVAVTTNANNNSFARGLDRLFNTRAEGLAFPSNSSPTISDSLIYS